ncbi:MAG: ribosome maturation factor RimM [Desulfovibrio sp.]
MMKNSDADASLLLVGVIAKPHGIRGELCIDSYADSPLLFEQAPCLYLRSGENAPLKKTTVESWRRHKGRVLLTLKGVHDRNISETMRGLEILVDKDALPETAEEEFYLHQLIGLEILNEDGSLLGELKDFIETPMQEVWVIITPEGKEILLPVVEEFIVDVDIESEQVTVAPPEGLIDIYLEEPKKKKKKRRHPSRRRKKKSE